jgi:DNA-binding beta-propeller fold protein YncE
VYAANPGGDTITPISTAIEEPGQPIVVGPSPDAMAITPDGRTVLVLTSTGVTPVDAVTNRAGKPVAIQGAYALAVAPDGSTAYVLAIPIRLADGQAGPPIAAGKIPARLAVSPDGKTVYVLDSNIFGGMGPGIPFRMRFRMLLRRPPFGQGRVIPIHVATNSAGRPIKVGRLPVAIAIAS